VKKPHWLKIWHRTRGLVVTNNEARNLKAGNKVLWVDPDDGECTKEILIKSISINGDVITISDDVFDIECIASELILLR